MKVQFNASALFWLAWILVTCASLPACQGPGTNKTPDTEDAAADSGSAAAAVFERLDNLPVSSMKKVWSHQPEEAEGDCSSEITRYEQNALVLDVEHVDCGGYGWNDTWYLLDKAGNLSMVHLKSTESHVDYDSEQFYYILSEKIIDFTGAQPTAKVRMDTLLQKSPETAVRFNDNYNSAPWITLDDHGNGFVFGRKIDFNGDWYPLTKQAIKDSLMKTAVIPRPVPIKFTGQIGMGMRGEFRSMGEEAVQEVLPVKEYAQQRQFDHFSRSKKQLQPLTGVGEELSREYWSHRHLQRLPAGRR
ncbi:MAG TPA: hypothetical protein PKE06_08390 [Flavilitoribacter sp.]|nr:hypothetical protein [Flavilitoribacter sp.]HMQ86401.1 hypothetical protein [Flavilitoribacter sp.]